MPRDVPRDVPGGLAALLAGPAGVAVDVFGAPEGQDARALAALAGAAGAAGVLHVAADARRVMRLRAALAFFAPEVEALVLPAWDALPYDRVSPGAAVMAARALAVARLRAPATRPRVLLTTARAALLRMPTRDALAAAVLRLAPGDAMDAATLADHLRRHGYVPTAHPREAGEFAGDPDRVDVLPPCGGPGLRLELSGARVAAVRAFDPQDPEAEGEELAEAVLPPASEVALDAEAAARFRASYAELFGHEAAAEDPLPAAIAAGRRPAGVEHWLPLFLAGTETIFDLLPDAAVTLDDDVEAARDARLAQIAHVYEARAGALAAGTRARLAPYRPVPPRLAFLDGAAWEEALSGRRVAVLRPEPPPEGEVAADAGGRPLGDTPAAVLERLRALAGEGHRILLAGGRAEERRAVQRRLRRAGFDRFAPVASWDEAIGVTAGAVVVAPLELEAGFVAEGMAVVAHADLDAEARADAERRAEREEADFETAGIADTDLAIGSLAVHLDHGIGLCEGLETVEGTGVPHDCLRLVYRDGDSLLVPVENLDLVWPFRGSPETVRLDDLGATVGSGAWLRRRDAVRDAVRVGAEALVRTEAERRTARVEPIRPPRGAWRRFTGGFPFEETPDQAKAIAAVLGDLASGRPMDRLVCGDVGFGKTEVALRAAFAVANAGRQAAVVVPTTPLARQHFEEFCERFAGFPVEVEQLSRAVGVAEARRVRDGLASGAVRVVVGTHALLAPSVRFADLGLLVVDEEHRLGVRQKERLRQLGAGTHVLTMTATPIPRTLQLAVAGLRDVSIIATAPGTRRPVRTVADAWDDDAVRDALLRERARGGQSFCVTPRVEDLEGLRDRLEGLAPGLRIVTAHGKLPVAELDEAMTGFAEGEGDVLLATNIIESGLNIPRANTLVVHRADLFGLAQLHQLRGRVGRGAVRGHAWFTWDPARPPTGPARERLHVLATLDRPGAGFELAARDMDIRGAGDLLGEAQSGHLEAVGAELFQELLNRAVAAAREGREMEDVWAPRLGLDVAVRIPEAYVPEPGARLALYRRLATLDDADAVEGFAGDLEERFGPLPAEVAVLLEVAGLKALCRRAGVEQLDVGPAGAVLGLRDGAVAERLAAARPDVKRRPDGRLVLSAGDRDAAAFRAAVREVLGELAAM
ncbi:transcription-repair coupling factor [Azospirillum sp.]|uniref:transcription-repair coupling factor n=1 Tax=Azospirillum sp. TaxID=34012 RepID=UPI002D61CC74|nr:DEAD/DEAH box helicase [Azospirillum sp.]HYD70039.1 DEAD/DEAH box helicase [Azospirillum sp.]